MITHPVTFRKPNRSGSLTIEMLVAGTLLATVMATLLPFLGRVSLVNKDISDRELMLHTVRDVVTDLQHDPDFEPTLPESMLRVHPEATIKIMSEEGDVSGMVKVSVTLQYNNRVGEPAKPISLSFWKQSKESSGGNR